MAEGINNLFDGDKGSKFLAMHKSAWVVFNTQKPKVLSSYQITSTGDAPGRDPKEWILEASNDGTHWTTIDTRRGEQEFSGRRATNEYKIADNAAKYSLYLYHFTQTKPTTLQYALADQPDDAVKYEIYGVFWHELVHGYQSRPETIKDLYSSGHDYYAFLEGVADLVRIRDRNHLIRSPDTGSINRQTQVNNRYLSGYTTTVFFLNWIVDNYD